MQKQYHSRPRKINRGNSINAFIAGTAALNPGKELLGAFTSQTQEVRDYYLLEAVKRTPFIRECGSRSWTLYAAHIWKAEGKPRKVNAVH